ncbi:Acetylglutamate kinase [Apostasia shenzhenica]|uniref:amino-acid N-acetyltransferase n=1 Tax=Apostasia shenzhenica TaxID=1088818 RepID=A0A2I0AWI3_9ASPA|nr:Acetylglutamate kinase [Apostasia shenzhenica]
MVFSRDISLLHGIGIKFVLIPGTHVTINELLAERGKMARFVGCYRVTDSDSLEAAMKAAGRIQLAMEAKLSPGPPMLSLCRHGDNNHWHEVGVFVASGNFLAAKRRGVVDGIDFGFTGEVKKIDVPRIRERLESNNLVIVSNLGYSSTGEVLNCNTYEVATACALSLEADKLICVEDGQARDENGIPPHFISLHVADAIIRKQANKSETAANYVKFTDLKHQICQCNFMSNGNGKTSVAGKHLGQRNNVELQNGVGCDRGNGIWSFGQGFAIGGEERLSRKNLTELAAAAFACKHGVRRVHIIDGTCNGAILLELFTRDGIGTMVASDVHEGIRMARDTDLQCIREVIHPLEESGALIRRSEEQLRKELDSFIVVEREGSVIACGALFPFMKEKCGEVAAFAVSPQCRGHGEGDKLLGFRPRLNLSHAGSTKSRIRRARTIPANIDDDVTLLYLSKSAWPDRTDSRTKHFSQTCKSRVCMLQLLRIPRSSINIKS